MSDEPKQAQTIQTMTNEGGDFLGLSAAPHEPRVVLQAVSAVPINASTAPAPGVTETRTSTPPTPRVVQPQTGTSNTPKK